jgi:hypothetical protein
MRTDARIGGGTADYPDLEPQHGSRDFSSPGSGLAWPVQRRRAGPLAVRPGPGGQVQRAAADRLDHRAAAPTGVPTWTLRTACPRIVTPGSNRQVTVLGAIDATAWQCIRRLGRRCAADFIDLLD